MKIYMNSIAMIIVLDFPNFFNYINRHPILRDPERLYVFSTKIKCIIITYSPLDTLLAIIFAQSKGTCTLYSSRLLYVCPAIFFLYCEYISNHVSGDTI